MASTIGTGSSALLRAISTPLKGWMKQHDAGPHSYGSRPAGELGTIIEADFIPRLMMSYTSGTEYPPADSDASIAPDDAAAFATLPLTLEADELLAKVEAYLRRGVGVETILLELLAPSARKLGQLWEEDECDFVDVTMGLWRLQEVMREIAARSPPVIRSMRIQRTALFAPMPGDQHAFGSLIVEEVFARAGWESEALIEPRRRELLRLLSDKPFDLVGLTVTNDCPSGALSKLISAIRTVSKNPQIYVLIGGRAINENPDLVAEVGADGTAVDAEAALELAASLMEGVRLGA